MLSYFSPEKPNSEPEIASYPPVLDSAGAWRAGREFYYLRPPKGYGTACQVLVQGKLEPMEIHAE